MRVIEATGVGEWSAIDLFSGAGGMSFGFHQHPRFRLVGAADAEHGKPSDGFGSLGCNSSYSANMGLEPVCVDLGTVSPRELRMSFNLAPDEGVDVLLACPPCTGFSRARSENHVVDDPRNQHVARTIEFVREFRPKLVFMENARELLIGKFRHHFQILRDDLEALGYSVSAKVFMLSAFGLPQNRERAIIVAALKPLPALNLDDLWDGFRPSETSLTVRAAISGLHSDTEARRDPMHSATKMQDPTSLARLAALPKDGGSWADLLGNPQTEKLLIPSMWTAVEKGRLNSYCDIYGRMWWDRPAPTIKRECSHPGNGRYCHPEEDRMCTVRELALLQGFPRDYQFVSRSRKNMYRHIGDAVPPLISYQLAHVAEWILTGCRPAVSDAILPGTHLRREDIQVAEEGLPLFRAASRAVG